MINVGVVIARFQVPGLHAGHKYLIDHVRREHDIVLILVGSTPGVHMTRKNPLDFINRVKMISAFYPDVLVLPIYDMPNDEDWSKSVDRKIHEAFWADTRAILYGSRDSFISRYSGKFETYCLFDTPHNESGTDIRDKLGSTVVNSPEFRQEIIYGAYNRFPIAYSTVDGIVLHGNAMLLGRKSTDPPKKYRFFGGFIDPSKDKSKELAVKREVYEETNFGIETDDPKYLGSLLVNDWRYQKTNDKIFTTVFILEYKFGSPEGGDDIDSVKWFQVKDLNDDIFVKEHIPIYEMFKKYLEE